MEVNNLNKNNLLGAVIVTQLTVSCEGIGTGVVSNCCI